MFKYIVFMRNVSQTEIADLVDVAPQTVYKWLHSKRDLPKRHYEPIAKILDVPEEFLTYEFNFYSKTKVDLYLYKEGMTDESITFFRFALDSIITSKQQENGI